MPHRIILCLTFIVGCASWADADWLRFRGPNGSGIAEGELAPPEWNGRADSHVWKVALPGRGVSAPIVVGDLVFVTCCSGYRQDRLHVLCFDAASGTRRWERQLWATGRGMTHPKTCTAAATPTSDGQRVYASFSTGDVVCLDLEGNVLWLRGLMLQYPNASNSLGLASSPIVVGDTFVQQIETDSQSIAVGLDAGTGQTRWQIDRPALASWTSPVLLRGDQEFDYLVVMQSGRGLSAYDPHTGDQAWQSDRGCATIPSGVARGDVLYVPSFGLTALQRRSGGSPPEVFWENSRLSPSTSSPLWHEGSVYAVSRSVLKCADAETGDLAWQLRLKGNFSSSPVVASGHMYLFSEEGRGQIIEIGRQRGRVVGEIELDETVLATPAIAHGGLYVRSDEHLWRFGPPEAE
jgi:outer membrane protein assembly factor BamB